MGYKMKLKTGAIVAVVLARAAIAAQPEGTSAAAVPTHYDQGWMGNHTASATAIHGDTIYFGSPWFVTTEYNHAQSEARHGMGGKTSIESVRIGQRFDVLRVITLLKDHTQQPLEIKTVKVGDATISEIRKDVLVATYSGQTLTPADIEHQSFIIVINSR